MNRTFCAALLTILLSCNPAWAGAKRDREQRDSGEETGVPVDGSPGFAPQERALVREYYLEHHGKGHCPPGLAKKQNGCLPPGQAKKRYAVGHRLGPSVVIEALPQDLVQRIGPAPAGYAYGMVDGDVVKLTLGTLLVVDAVNSLVQ